MRTFIVEAQFGGEREPRLAQVEAIDLWTAWYRAVRACKVVYERECLAGVWPGRLVTLSIRPSNGLPRRPDAGNLATVILE
jgi:hypothetical protein